MAYESTFAIYWPTLDAVTCLAGDKTTVAPFQLSFVLLIVVARVDTKNLGLYW